MKSLLVLFQSPYNKRNPLSALYRFAYWKIIRLFRMKKLTYKLWNNKKLFLYYDSLQCMWLMYNYEVDFEEFNLIKDYLRPNEHVADVGANMGYYTIWMSKYIAGNGTIHSFEPNQNNFLRLKNNCDLNNLNNLILNNIALSDTKENILFTKSLDGENHISLEPNDDTILIPCNTLDDYSKEKGIKHFAYIKVDIEGFELSFLHGAHQLLKSKAIDIIQLEINDHVNNSTTKTGDLFKKISDIDYKLCKYDTLRKQLIETTYKEERDNYFIVSNLELINNRLLSL